jgi:predicted ribosome quality control (RQC) complex YloA/Tae2 family protein
LSIITAETDSDSVIFVDATHVNASANQRKTDEEICLRRMNRYEEWLHAKVNGGPETAQKKTAEG